jgi:hypothetical protein
MKVTYRSTGGAVCFYVTVEGEARLIRLNGFDRTAEVEDAKLQKAIEASALFREGRVERVEDAGTDGTVGTGGTGGPGGAAVYEDVTDVNGAVEVLKTVYGVAAIALRTPDGVRKQAEKAGAAFPNWL